MSAPVAVSEVWTVEFEATGPEPGDYEGWTSIHASRTGAGDRLVERFVGAGVPVPLAYLRHSRCNADNGSYAGDFEAAVPAGSITVSYGVHRMPIER